MNAIYETVVQTGGRLLGADWRTQKNDLLYEVIENGCKNEDWLEELLSRGGDVSEMKVVHRLIYPECEKIYSRFFADDEELTTTLFRRAVITRSVNDETILRFVRNGAEISEKYPHAHVQLSFFPTFLDTPPLNECAHRNRVLVMKELIARGANIDDQDSIGFTALHRAVLGLSLEAAELLVSSGADTEIKSNSGVSALELAELHLKKSHPPLQFNARRAEEIRSRLPAIIDLLSQQ